MMSDEPLPPDEIYADGICVGKLFLDEIPRPTPIHLDIDWTLPGDTPRAVRQATVRAAVQFHYANVAHLLLCGDILSHRLPDTSLDA